MGQENDRLVQAEVSVLQTCYGTARPSSFASGTGFSHVLGTLWTVISWSSLRKSKANGNEIRLI